MKRNPNIRTTRILALAALAIPLAAVAQEPPEQAPVDPATPLDTSPPAEATPPDDPTETTPPWAPPARDPTTQAPPPATPPAQSDTTDHMLQDEHGRDATLTERPPDSVVGDYRVDFDALDTDGDGYISRSEARANPTLHAEFDGVDRDRDGRLSPEELADWNR